MSEGPRIDAFLQLDRIVHEPARLLILTMLAGAESVEFRYIEALTGLSKGNLSSHMSKLEMAGLILIEKSFRAKKPLTTLRITADGAKALHQYRARLADVVANIPMQPGVKP